MNKLNADVGLHYLDISSCVIIIDEANLLSLSINNLTRKKFFLIFVLCNTNLFSQMNSFVFQMTFFNTNFKCLTILNCEFKHVRVVSYTTSFLEVFNF